MNIGLIGYGFMGGAHLAAMEQLPDVTVTRLASRTRPSPDGPARGNLDLKSGPLPQTVQWSADWEDVVSDPSIDAVDICLPTHLHHQVALSALAHGKHVLCEKPMALTTDQCADLLRASEAAGRILMVAQVLRFMQPYRYAAEFIRSAGVEAVRGCVLERSTGYPQWSDWLAKEDRSGGATLDLLSHDLDQALLWFGDPVSVRAVSIGAIDTIQAELLFNNGLQVEVRGGWLAPEVAFSAGFRISTATSELTFAAGSLQARRSGQLEEIALPEQDAYAEEIGYFIDCCRSGSKPTLCPPADSAKAVRLARMLTQSRDEGGRELSWR